MPEAIDTVIFDLGRVLIDFDHNRSASAMAAASRMSVNEVYGLFFDSQLVQRFEAGRLSPEHFYQEVKRMLGFRMSMPAFVAVWNDIFFLSEKNKQVHALAMRLRRRYTVAVLSNINALHFAFIKKKYPVLNRFSHVIASCEEGYIKPHPLIYRRALKRLGAKPRTTLYIDDRPDLIAAARRLGINSFVFTGIEQLYLDLSRAGMA